MHDVVDVGFVHRPRNLRKQCRDFSLRQQFFGVSVLSERRPLNDRHRQEVCPVDVADIIDGANVRMAN